MNKSKFSKIIIKQNNNKYSIIIFLIPIYIQFLKNLKNTFLIFNQNFNKLDKKNEKF